MLLERGRVEETITVLRLSADAGNEEAATQLVTLLARENPIDGLEPEVAAGTIGAAPALQRHRNT